MSRNKMRKLPPPDKGPAPKRITTKNPPGGPHTPGAKKARADKERAGVEASKVDDVKHKTFKNKSGNKENKTG